MFSPTKATILVQGIIIFLGSLQWPRSSPYASFLCITVGAVVPCLGFFFRMVWPSPISAGNVACLTSHSWIPPLDFPSAKGSCLFWAYAFLLGLTCITSWNQFSRATPVPQYPGVSKGLCWGLMAFEMLPLPNPAFLASHRCSRQCSSGDAINADLHLRGCFLGKPTCSLSHISLKSSLEGVLICILDAIIPHSSTLFPYFTSQ